MIIEIKLGSGEAAKIGQKKLTEKSQRCLASGPRWRTGLILRTINNQLRLASIPHVSLVILRMAWWVKERQQWLGRVRGPDGRQKWIKAADLRSAKET